MKQMPMHESMQVGVLLALAGGYMDAYTYLCRGGVFANAQTGNIVLLGVHLFKGRFLQAGYYLLPILAFVAGVLFAEIFRKKARRGVSGWRGNIILLEIVLLLAVGAIPIGMLDSVVNITISFVCAMQMSAFRMLDGRPYATTMCTGNLRSATENIYRAVCEKDRAAQKTGVAYYAVIFVFCAGAGLGALAVVPLGYRAAWLCCVPLAAAWWLLFRAGQRV